MWVVCQVQAPAVALGFKTEVRLGRAQQSAFRSRVAAQSTTVSPLSPSSYWPGLARHWRGTGLRAASLGEHAAGRPDCEACHRRRRVLPLGCWDAQHMRGAAALHGLPLESHSHSTRACAQGTVGAKQVTECKGKKLNVAINGFGRIGVPALPPGRLTAHGACLRWCRAVSAAGRNFLRCVEGRDNSNLNIVVINDSGAPRPRALFPSGGAVPCRPAPCISTFGRLSCRPRRAGGVKQASHLLKYDSTLGTFNADVQCAPTRWPRRVERARRCV